LDKKKPKNKYIKKYFEGLAIMGAGVFVLIISLAKLVIVGNLYE